jgi:intracellular multiplication protein IcmO
MRGTYKNQEVDAAKLLRDTRSSKQKAKDHLKNPKNIAFIFLLLAGICLFMPAINEFIFIIAIGLFFHGVSQTFSLPVRMPLRSKIKDFNDLNPGNQKPMKASGIAFFGNDRKSKEEIWFKNGDMRTHILMFGSTGSGKTEALASISFNALVQGSGFIYVDGKGDNSLFAKIFSMARFMGREDDILLINFMTGARDVVGAQKTRLSNTMNPFCTGSSSMLSQLVVSLMSGKGGDGDMWKGRAISFVEALMKILVFCRDKKLILLDANTIRNYFSLEKLEIMVIDKKLPRENQSDASLEEVPKLLLEPLTNYVINLPGYNKERKGEQVSQVLEQHGYITMQLTRTFSSLADTYSHIIRTNLAEVDFKDVVINRRILIVLLPALEKSPDELSNLGKIIIASLKAMMASGLGDEVEGTFQDVVERKPTNAPTPFMCILDEYGYYAVQGFAVVAAQARSLGFSAVFAGQDLPAFQKASKEEAASIGANTNIKICMKLEDPVDTFDFFNKTAGQSYVTKVDSFQSKSGAFSSSYKDNKSASFEKRSRIDLLDLKDQTEGQAHIFFRSDIIRMSMFYANPVPVNRLKVNQFLRVEPPTESELKNISLRKVKALEAISNVKSIEDVKPNSSIQDIITKLNVDNGLDLNTKTNNYLNEFLGSLKISSSLEHYVDKENEKTYLSIIEEILQIDKKALYEKIKSIEVNIGASSQQAYATAKNIFDKLFVNLNLKPLTKVDGDILHKNITEFIDYINNSEDDDFLKEDTDTSKDLDEDLDDLDAYLDEDFDDEL